MDSREKIIRLWFDMWLQRKDLGIEDIFSADALYIESSKAGGRSIRVLPK